jgi:hypothetical protein
MGLLPIFQLTVAAASDTIGVVLLRIFSVAMTTPSPRTTRRLPAVDPNVAEALAIVTLAQATFGLEGLERLEILVMSNDFWFLTRRP